MNTSFEKEGWEDFQSWLDDKKILKKLLRLIQESQRTPREGSGKPERLRYYEGEVWSRELTKGDRLVYRINEDDSIIILQCRFHYDDK